MTSLDDLLKTFNIQPEEETEKTAAAAAEPTTASSQGGEEMSLANLFLSLEAQDGQIKEAAEAESQAAGGEVETNEAELGEAIEEAAGEAVDASIEKEASIKLAAEYDAAGRIMARAFYDELTKIGASLEQTHATPTELEPASASKQEAVGPRGTQYQIKANFAGSPGHDQPITTAGSRQVNKDALKDKGAKGTSVGAGVTEQASAVPMFATVKNLMG